MSDLTGDGAPLEPGVDDTPLAVPATATEGSGDGYPPNPPLEPGLAGPGRDPNWMLIAAVALVALVLLVVAILVWSSDDDTADSVSPTTVDTAVATTIVDSTVPPTVSTTDVSTTTTSTSEATTTTSTSTTTVPETTTTTVPETTTTVASTSTTTTTLPVVTVPPAPEATVWDVIENSPALSEFRDLIVAADLVSVLDGPRPVTVFAPSNAAVELLRLGVGGSELLDDPEPLMRRHVVAGRFTAEDVLALTSLESLSGDMLSIDAAAVTIEGAQLIVVDIEVGGSILHVIDIVMVGPQ